MAISYKLPKITNDQVVLLNTPVAGDTVLATGVLTIKDEAGNIALNIKAADFLSFNYEAATAGVANAVDADLSGVIVNPNTPYVMSIKAPYVQDFFGGGQETGAVYTVRSYTVSVPALPAPTPAILQAAFVARINSDVNNYFSATAEAGNVVRLTADSAMAGPLNVEAPAGTIITDFTAWVAPVGTISEVIGYVNDSTIVTGPSYDRFVVTARKPINNNIVNGLQVIKVSKFIVYMNTADGGTAAAVSLLTSILDGSYASSLVNTAKYLGCPSV